MIRKVVGAHVAMHRLVVPVQDRMDLVNAVLELDSTQRRTIRILRAAETGNPRPRRELAKRAVHRLYFVDLLIELERALISFPQAAIERLLSRRGHQGRVHAKVEIEALFELFGKSIGFRKE